MDRAMLREHLAQCERHVAQGYRHISRQREIIARLDADGHENLADDARDLLGQFEKMQVEHVAHRDRILAQLAQNSN